MEQNRNLPTPSSVLTFGIIGLATCELGIIGLIFSIIALSKAGKFRRGSTERSGQVNTGRGLAIAGLIISIIMIIVWIILIVAGVFSQQ